MELGADGITEYAGDYDYYIEKKKILSEDQFSVKPDVTASSLNNKIEWLKKKESESEERKRLSYISKVEKEIAEREAKISECETLLSDENTASDASAAAELYEEKTRNEERLLVLYAEWERIHKGV
jgi:ATP-binding cassette subfamily F protein 3